jgi:hypothetical protein
MMKYTIEQWISLYSSYFSKKSYIDDSFLGYSVVLSRSKLTFQKRLLPPSSGQWWRQDAPLKCHCFNETTWLYIPESCHFHNDYKYPAVHVTALPTILKLLNISHLAGSVLDEKHVRQNAVLRGNFWWCWSWIKTFTSQILGMISSAGTF